MTGSQTLGTQPLPYLDLFRIQTSETGDTDRALAGSDTLNIHFGVVFDESSDYQVATKVANEGKFFVHFPPQYEILPVAQVVGGATGSELTCKLFEVFAATGDLTSDDTSIVDGTCTWNYTIDPRGNSL